MNSLIIHIYLTFSCCIFLYHNSLCQQSDSLNLKYLQAVYEENIEETTELIENGANINYISSSQNTSGLHYAVMNNNIQMLYLLIDNGINIEMKDYLGNTPLAYAASLGLDSLMYILIMENANIETVNYKIETPLHLAVLSGNIYAVDLLIFYKANINASSIYKITPLELAVYNKLYDITYILLQNGANPNLSNTHGYTPLMHAVDSQDFKTLMIFAELEDDKIIEIDYSKNHNKLGIMDIALMNDNKEVVEFLQKRIDDKNKKNDSWKEFTNNKLLWKHYFNYRNFKPKDNILKKYNIKRPLAPYFSSLSLYNGINFNTKDIFFEHGVMFRELNYNTTFSTGFATRYWRCKKYYNFNNNDTILLLKEYRLYFWSDIQKRIKLSYSNNSFFNKTDLSFGLKTQLNSANYKGMEYKEKPNLTFSPIIGFTFRTRLNYFSIAYQYWKNESLNSSPHHFVISSFIKLNT